MATNFFQQQDSARRKTFQLVVYFVLAILILIALVYGLLLALDTAREPASWWQPELLLSPRWGWALWSAVPARSRWPSSLPAARPWPL
jgi:hypothetical protein